MALAKFLASLSFCVFISNMKKIAFTSGGVGAKWADRGRRLGKWLFPVLLVYLWPFLGSSPFLAATHPLDASTCHPLRFRLHAGSVDTQTIFRCLSSFIFYTTVLLWWWWGRKRGGQPERKDGAQPWRSVDLTGDGSWWAGAPWGPLPVHSIRRCHQEIGGGAAELRLLRKEEIKEDWMLKTAYSSGPATSLAPGAFLERFFYPSS